MGTPSKTTPIREDGLTAGERRGSHSRHSPALFFRLPNNRQGMKTGAEAPWSLEMCAPHCDWAPTHGKLARHVEQCRLFAGADKRGPMRTLVDPPLSLRCGVCNGELRLKKIQQDTSPLKSDITTFVCAKCGRDKSYRASGDPHSAPGASKKRRATWTRARSASW